MIGSPKPHDLMSQNIRSIDSGIRGKASEFQASKVGCPIRKSADQSFFAAPHGLSQRSTSFIASQRQGIHRMPLRHLIALIINAHPLDRTALMRKTSLLQDRPDGDAVKLHRRQSAPATDKPPRTLGSISSSRCQTTRAAPPWAEQREIRLARTNDGRRMESEARLVEPDG